MTSGLLGSIHCHLKAHSMFFFEHVLTGDDLFTTTYLLVNERLLANLAMACVD